MKRATKRTAHQSRTRDQQTIRSFSKALDLIDQFRKSTPDKRDPSLDFLLWKCTAEVEYVAFRIAIINDLGDYDPETITAGTLSADRVRDLIDKARTALDSDPREAYKNVREAVGILRKMSRPGARNLQTHQESSPING
jgi:hypothetical protein